MHYMLNENDLRILQEVSDITLGDYEIKGKFISLDNLMNVIEDLLTEVHKKEEELNDLKQEIEDNYEPKKIDYYERYGLSKKDFIEE